MSPREEFDDIIGGKGKSAHEVKTEGRASTWLYGQTINADSAQLRYLADNLINEFGVSVVAASRMLVQHMNFKGVKCDSLDRAALDAVRAVVDNNRRINRHAHSDTQGQSESADSKRFKFIDSKAFDSGDYRPEWHVRGVLVRNQPAAIAGPSKGLKTNISLDLAISLASGTPFLGEFEVTAPTRVAIVSGESGPHTLQETARRICKRKGLNLADLDKHLCWCFCLPTFSDLPGMVEYAKQLADLGAEVSVLDPLYQSLGAVDARNLFEMGTALRTIGDMILKAGATPVLLHHANGRLQTGQVMELTDLAYTGLEQYVRQWMLINRQEKYAGDGIHDLAINIGGSAGQSKLLSVHIEEGVINDMFAGRTWNVSVQSFTDAKLQEKEAKTERNAGRERATEKKHDALVLDAIDAVIGSGQDAATLNDIKAKSTLNGTNARKAINRLLEDGCIIKTTCTKKHAGKNTEWKAKEAYRRNSVQKQATIEI